MSYLQRIQYVAREHGVSAVFGKFFGIAADRWFDWRFSTDNRTPTALSEYTIVGESRDHATSYGASRVMPLKRLFPALKRHVPGGGVFVDLGCGNGKVLLVAAHCGFQKVRGVEFARELCELARRNWSNFASRTGAKESDCVIHENDVSLYDYQPDETAYFIYNPFDQAVLRKVLAKISESIRQRPRTVAIVICNPNPIYQSVMKEHPEYPLVETVKAWGYPYFVYLRKN
jgi:SAM-dependent methyltransferase